MPAAESVQLWQTVRLLVDRVARRRALGGALSAWGRLVEAERKRKRDALFDAMGSQMRAAKRRCIGLEDRLARRRPPLAEAFDAWRCRARLRRRPAAAVELCRRCAEDA
ncbi:unnamed protein product, partial [Prorocentrum cordatum]